MILYECIAQKNIKKLTGIVIILIGAAALTFLTTSIFTELPYRWAVQLLGFACLSAVVFITAKYLTKSFVYSIKKKKDGGLDLVVDELANGGKKRLTVCRISISNIEEVCVLDKRNDTDKIKIDKLLERAKSEKRSVFSYCQDIAPSRLCYILVTECDEPLLLKLFPDKTVEDYLSGRIGVSEE